eukprot:PhM_4_TR18848/c1_g1_i2/m.70494
MSFVNQHHIGHHPPPQRGASSINDFFTSRVGAVVEHQRSNSLNHTDNAMNTGNTNFDSEWDGDDDENDDDGTASCGLGAATVATRAAEVEDALLLTAAAAPTMYDTHPVWLFFHDLATEQRYLEFVQDMTQRTRQMVWLLGVGVVHGVIDGIALAKAYSDSPGWCSVATITFASLFLLLILYCRGEAWFRLHSWEVLQRKRGHRMTDRRNDVAAAGPVTDRDERNAANTALIHSGNTGLGGLFVWQERVVAVIFAVYIVHISVMSFRVYDTTDDLLIFVVLFAVANLLSQVRFAYLFTVGGAVSLPSLLLVVVLIPGRWDEATAYETPWWLCFFIFSGMVYFTERTKRMSFCQVDTNRNELKAIENHIEVMQDILATFFPRTPTRDLLAQRVETYSKPYPGTALIVTDISGFTAWSTRTEPRVVIDVLARLMYALESASPEYNVERVYTVGDSFVGAVFPMSSHAPQTDTNLVGYRCVQAILF